MKNASLMLLLRRLLVSSLFVMPDTVAVSNANFSHMFSVLCRLGQNGGGSPPLHLKKLSGGWEEEEEGSELLKAF